MGLPIVVALKKEDGTTISGSSKILIHAQTNITDEGYWRLVVTAVANQFSNDIHKDPYETEDFLVFDIDLTSVVSPDNLDTYEIVDEQTSYDLSAGYIVPSSTKTYLIVYIKLPSSTELQVSINSSTYTLPAGTEFVLALPSGAIITGSVTADLIRVYGLDDFANKVAASMALKVLDLSYNEKASSDTIDTIIVAVNVQPPQVTATHEGSSIVV